MSDGNNILQMPDKLERLAAQINADLSREASNRTEWTEIQIDKCAHLFAARSEFAANQEFGRWCSANGFGDNVLSHQDRAACIAMGSDVKALREVLDGTASTSIRMIYSEHRDRFTNTGKTTSTQTSPLAPKASPVTDRVYEAMKAAQAAGEKISDMEAARRAGGSNLTAQRARARLDAEQALKEAQAAGLPNNDRAEFRSWSTPRSASAGRSLRTTSRSASMKKLRRGCSRTASRALSRRSRPPTRSRRRTRGYGRRSSTSWS